MQKPTTEKIRRYIADPLEFLFDLLIPGPDGPVVFRKAMADFQREYFEAIAPCLLALSEGRRPPLRGLWTERTKGASKDSDLAACILWLLAFSGKNLSMECGANDLEQSRELMKAARDLVGLNPWIKDRVEFQRFMIRCPRTGSRLDFLTSDASGSHGSRPHVVVINELSHIGSADFAATLADNNAKVPQGLMLIATNAGFVRTWQHRWRTQYSQNDRWFFQSVCKPAPWLDPRDIEEARARNTLSRFNRLWYGVWSSGGDALNAEDVEACVTLCGPMREALPGWVYGAGLDLGVKHDHSGLVVLGCQVGTGRVALGECRSWAPGPGGQVSLIDVRQGVLDAYHRFGLGWVGFDPSQAVLMAQELEAAGVPMAEVPFVGRTLDQMARDLLQAFRARRIDLYRDEELLNDLHRLSIVERKFGFKLEAISDSTGHADRATALAIVLPTMLEVSQLEPEPPEPDDFDNYPSRVIA